MENSGREQRKYTGKEWGENRVEGVIIIGEDFNARTGKKGEEGSMKEEENRE